MKNKKTNKKTKFNFREKIRTILLNRKIKYNSLITILIFIFIAIVLTFNIVVSILIDRYDIKIDLTSDRLYKVSDETKEFLQDYNKKAKLILLNDEESFKKSDDIYSMHIYNMSKNIASCSDNISIEFVNLHEHPSFASQYPKFNLQQNGILIVDEYNNAQFIPIFRMFKSQYDEASGANGVQVISNVERNIAHALEFLSGKEKVRTLLISGHDEADLKGVQGEFFEENGYDLIDFNLITTKLSDEDKLIIICAPMIDYKEEEIEKLQKFVDSGKKLIYFASASQPKLPNFDAFILKNTGVSSGKGVIVETDPNRMTISVANEIFTYANYSNKYTEDMMNKKLPISFNDCKPLNIEEDKERDKGLERIVIAETEDSSAVLEDPKSFDIKTAEKKAFPVAVGVTKKLKEGKEAKITIFSTTNIVGGVEVLQFGNSEFILSVFGETVGNRSKTKILPKIIGVPHLVMTRTTAAFLGVLFILVLPISVGFVGIFVYYRRRRI